MAPATRAPGPHAFAVRSRIARLTMRSRPSHPAVRSVTIGPTSLLSRRDGRTETYILFFVNREIAGLRSERPHRSETIDELRFYENRFSQAFRPKSPPIQSKIAQIDLPDGHTKQEDPRRIIGAFMAKRRGAKGSRSISVSFALQAAQRAVGHWSGRMAGPSNAPGLILSTKDATAPRVAMAVWTASPQRGSWRSD